MSSIAARRFPGPMVDYPDRPAAGARREVAELFVDEEETKLFNILLVEDNPGDARLAREASAECRVPNQLFVVENGLEAMDFLYQMKRYVNAPRPDLILLDLNLPWKDGREVLAEIKSDGDLKRIPVVILTISRAEEDINTSYDMHANCYLTKPLDLNQFVTVMKSINSFWLTAAHLPS